MLEGVYTVEDKKPAKSFMKRIMGQKNDEPGEAKHKESTKEGTKEGKGAKATNEKQEKQASTQTSKSTSTQTSTQKREAAMTEETSPSTSQPSSTPESKTTDTVFNVGRFFVKKMDFDGTEAVTSITTNPGAKNPEIKIELSLKSNPLQNDVFEVDLGVKATGTIEGKPYFVGSVEQAGFFTAKNFNTQQLDYLLKSYCPNLLFPYARENLANVMVRGGFNALEIPPVDFAALYQKSLEEAKKKEMH